MNSSPDRLQVLVLSVYVISKMSDIPSELFVDILCRVPAEPLLRFRCVCKAWCRIIDDPKFIKDHLDRQLLMIHDSSNGIGHLLLLKTSKRHIYSLPLDLLNFDGAKKFTTARIYPNPLQDSRTDIVPCHGLVLVSHYRLQKLWSIWNPLTRELHNLPMDGVKLRIPGTLFNMVSGFGYDCVSDDYKVLRHARGYDKIERTFKYDTRVYSFKSGSWKRIKDFPYWISRWTNGVYLNGALHWIVKTLQEAKTPDMIVAYDLENEDYRFYPIPFSLFGKSKPSRLDLGVLGGYLSLSQLYSQKRLETWLMNDYGNDNSWTMLFSIERWEYYGELKSLRTVSYSKSTGLVLLLLQKDDTDEFFWFDTKNNHAKNISFRGSMNIFSPQIFLASLVRINEKKRKRSVDCP